MRATKLTRLARPSPRLNIRALEELQALVGGYVEIAKVWPDESSALRR